MYRTIGLLAFSPYLTILNAIQNSINTKDNSLPFVD